MARAWGYCPFAQCLINVWLVVTSGHTPDTPAGVRVRNHFGTIAFFFAFFFYFAFFAFI